MRRASLNAAAAPDAATPSRDDRSRDRIFLRHRCVEHDDRSLPAAHDRRRAPRRIAASASPAKPVKGMRFRDSRGNSKNLPRKTIVKGV